MGRVINIGNNEEISINRLAQKVKELAESFSLIVHIPYEKAYAEGFEDMVRRVPDLRLARQLIGFQPRYSLDDILLDVVNHLSGAIDTEELTIDRTPMGKRKPYNAISGRRVDI